MAIAKPIALWTALSLSATPSLAQQTPPPANPVALEKVEIQGHADNEVSDMVGARSVIKRSEIERFGDTLVVDTLRRLPGITVTPTPGKSSEIRLRGMAAGYVRILINGEAPPAGFSVDSLATSQVEAIEVQRGGVADSGAQSIAGTINIILKTASAPAEKTLKLTAGWQASRPSGAIDYRWSEREGELRRSFGASLQHESSVERGHSEQRLESMGSIATTLIDQETRTSSPTLNLSGGFGFKRSSGLSWRLEGSLRHREISEANEEVYRSAGLGSSTSIVDQTDSRLKTSSIQTKLLMDQAFENGSKIDGFVSLNAHKRTMSSQLTRRDDASAIDLTRDTESTASTRSTTLSAKYRTPFVPNHDVLFAGEVEDAWRREGRTVDELSAVGRNAVQDTYDAQVVSSSLTVRDEWAYNSTIGTHLGLRFETIHVKTVGTGLSKVTRSESVLSPTIQISYDTGEDAAPKLTVGLSRTYKAPAPRDLIPHRWLSSENGPLNPDEEGNPLLRPELAWGLDATVSRKLGAGVQLSVSGFQRQIEDVVLRETLLDGSRWLERKRNEGRALVRGVELDSQFDVQRIWTEAPKLTTSFYAARNYSKLLDVGTGEAHMDQHIPMTLKASWEHQLKASRTKWGGAVQYEMGGASRYSNAQVRTSTDQTLLDIYVAFVPAPKHSVRITLNNVLGADRLRHDLFSSNFNLAQDQRINASPSLKASWQIPL